MDIIFERENVILGSFRVSWTLFLNEKTSFSAELLEPRNMEFNIFLKKLYFRHNFKETENIKYAASVNDFIYLQEYNT